MQTGQKGTRASMNSRVISKKSTLASAWFPIASDLVRLNQSTKNFPPSNDKSSHSKLLGQTPYRKTVRAAFTLRHEEIQLDFAFGIACGDHLFSACLLATGQQRYGTRRLG